MKFGFVMPFGDARSAADHAQLAEQAGWDGFFVSEPVWGVDAWVSLTAAAMVTQRIRLGTLLSPLSRMRPWRLASQTAALDNLSGGRVILSVGLGATDTGFESFGEVTDRKTRAELLDEGLDILTGLWKGQPFRYRGRHYQVDETSFYPPPPPVQQPRIPIWVVGAWPSHKSMQRALRYDGLIPSVVDTAPDGARLPRQALPSELSDIRDYVRACRESAFPGGAPPYDIVVEGETPWDDPDAAAVQVLTWREAGATWWIESRWTAIDQANPMEVVRQRIHAGPPIII